MKTKKRKLSYLGLGLTPEEDKEIERIANESGYGSMKAWIRKTLRNAIDKNKLLKAGK